jgi:recombination protein RecR
MEIPRAIKNLIEQLSSLPSIGPRQATRIAFYLASRNREITPTLAQNITDLSKIKNCEECFFIFENEGKLCSICSNSNRKKNILAIVEKETDLISIENTGKFNGRYLVLGQIPRNGVLGENQKYRLEILKKFCEKQLGGIFEEIILAFNPTTSGNFNTTLITKILSPLTKKISRLGRGLPTGGEIEFADDETLGEALRGRS